MPEPRLPRLALTDRAGRLRILAVQESGHGSDVLPPVDAAEVEHGALPRLSWPSWADRGRLVVSATTANGRPALWLLDPGHAKPVLLYRPPPGQPVEIAPGVPHYANPSPDGRAIALATPGERALVLLLADPNQPGDPPEVTRGAPIFSTWSPSGDALLVHAGAVIQRMDRAAPGALTTVGLNSVDIRVPAWSPDGQHFATIRHGESRNAVVLHGRDGHHLARIGAVRGTGALAWSPDGALLAVSGSEGGNAHTSIDLIRVRGNETENLVKDRILLWLWSPDGSRIAYLRRAGVEGALAWRIVHLDGRTALSSGPFYPGPLFAVVIAFFDQYLHSQRLWSPDGRFLLAAGRIAVNGPPPDVWGGNILLWDTAGGHPLQVLAQGEIASWHA